MTLQQIGLYGGLGQLGARVGRAAASNWWLAGGVDPSDVDWAYQPKGAASKAASLVNLNDPGTQDAIENVPFTWSADQGWILDNGGICNGGTVIPTDAKTILIRYSGLSSGGTYQGIADSFATDGIAFLTRAGVYTGWQSGANLQVVYTDHPFGVIGWSATRCYFDGLDTGLNTDPGFSAPYPLLIGGLYYGYPNSSRVQAAVMYKSSKTASQMAEISAAMAAL